MNKSLDLRHMGSCLQNSLVCSKPFQWLAWKQIVTNKLYVRQVKEIIKGKPRTIVNYLSSGSEIGSCLFTNTVPSGELSFHFSITEPVSKWNLRPHYYIRVIMQCPEMFDTLLFEDCVGDYASNLKLYVNTTQSELRFLLIHQISFNLCHLSQTRFHPII